MEIRVITELKEAERLWRALSPNKVIFDDWDFRYCFYKYKPCPLKFYAAFEKTADGEELVGLMPLQFNAEWGGLEFFAEDPCEDNRVFIKPGHEPVIAMLYKNLKETAKFFDISGEDEFTTSLEIEDYDYALPLQGINNFDDYLKSRLSAKRQRNLRSSIQKAEGLPIKVFINRPQDLDALFALNNKNFSDSYLESEEDRRPWRSLLDLPFHWVIMSLEIDGQVQAVSFSVLYNNIYFYLITGVNFKDFSSLGKYLNRLNIEKALELKADSFDAGLGDCNWKKLWHLDPKPQYEFIKEV